MRKSFRAWPETVLIEETRDDSPDPEVGTEIETGSGGGRDPEVVIGEEVDQDLGTGKNARGTRIVEDVIVGRTIPAETVRSRTMTGIQG